jgi:hypothetical protein
MTSYDVVFRRFLNRITDYDLPLLPEEDLDEMMCGWLTSAIANFTRCKSDLSNRDDEAQTFNADLTNYEIEVLSLYMVCAWLDQKINSVLLTNQFIGGKESNYYSQANQLGQLKALRDATFTEARKLPRDYSYVTNDYFG